MSEQNSNCPCPESTMLPVNGICLEGVKLAVDASALPGKGDIEEALEAARQAQQTADTARGRADEAYDLAANADGKAENAINTADEAKE